MRSVFGRIFPDSNIDTATPIVVLAVQDKRNLQAVEPPAYLGKGQLNIVGLFLRTPEKKLCIDLAECPRRTPVCAHLS